MGWINPMCSDELKNMYIGSMSYLQWPFLVLSVACPYERHVLPTNFLLPSFPLKMKIWWSHGSFQSTLSPSASGNSKLLLTIPTMPSWLTSYLYSNTPAPAPPNFLHHTKSQKYTKIFLLACSKDRISCVVYRVLCTTNAFHSALSL